MGFPTSIFPTPANVLQMAHELPEGSLFFVAGIGPFQLPLTTLSMLLGGHVRVGLEDNIYYRRGSKASGNGELVARAVRLAEELQRPVASAAEARTLLGLPTR
jgi:3-keto-5-aminohexanoate cleavage enzyme